MIGNLKSEETILSKTFTQTSEKLYDRHDYRLVSNNNESIVFGNYHDVRQVWHSTPPGILSHVEVLDKKKMKTKNKGFG